MTLDVVAGKQVVEQRVLAAHRRNEQQAATVVQASQHVGEQRRLVGATGTGKPGAVRGAFRLLPSRSGRVARLQRRGREHKPELEQIGERFWIYRPPAIGLPGLSHLAAVSRINGWILAQLLRGVQRRLGFRDPILWSPFYNSGTLLKYFPARLKIFESHDYDAALARSAAQRAMILRLEAETCRAADLVFAVTDELAEPLRVHNPNMHVVYCAAAPDVFGRALLPETVVPEVIARLPKPVIGYLGGVDPWKIDIGLLHHVARSHPEWSIALVGCVWFGFDASVFADFPQYPCVRTAGIRGLSRLL